MNKKEQRALENRIRDVMEESAELTSDEIAKIRERAYLAYQQKIENEKQPAREKRKKSGLLRRAVAVFAIAIGLIVVSVVYSVLAPVTVGNANSFVRRAAIWINDQLHLGISFPKPEDEENIEKANLNSFSSIEETSKALNMPIVYINHIEGLIYCGSEITSIITDLPILLLHYKIDNSSISISMEKLHDDDVLSVNREESCSFLSPIGELYVFESNGINRALTIYDGYIVEIYGSIPKELFQQCCSALAVVN